MKIEDAKHQGFKLSEDGFYRQPIRNGWWQKWHFMICRTCKQKYLTVHPKGSKFCSKPCFKGINEGPKNAWWVDGRSYKGITRADGSKVSEHRHLIEQMLGRRLQPKEIVHHKNHNHRDNRIENLEIMTQAQHAALHLETRKPRNELGQFT